MLHSRRVRPTRRAIVAHRNGVFTALGYCVKPHPPYRRVIVVGQDGESSLSGEASCCGDMSKLQVAVSSHGGNSAWCDQAVRRCGRSQWMINVASQRRPPHGVGQHCGPRRHARVLRRGVKSAWRVQVSSHRRKPLWHLAETKQRVVPASPPPPRCKPSWRAAVAGHCGQVSGVRQDDTPTWEIRAKCQRGNSEWRLALSRPRSDSGRRTHVASPGGTPGRHSAGVSQQGDSS